MKNLILSSILFLSFNCFCLAQKVHSVDYENQVEVKVLVVKYENQADLKVFKVKYNNQAGQNDGKWFLPKMLIKPIKRYSLSNTKTKQI